MPLGRSTIKTEASLWPDLHLSVQIQPAYWNRLHKGSSILLKKRLRWQIYWLHKAYFLSSGGYPLLLTLIPKLLPFLKARQKSQPLLRSIHELPKANSTLGSYRKLLRYLTRLSQPIPWIIPLFTKQGYSKHRERGVEKRPSQSIGTIPIWLILALGRTLIIPGLVPSLSYLQKRLSQHIYAKRY